MNTYSLNGKMMKTRDAAYDHIAQALGFPDYFGRNLDALYDLLCERGGRVTLKHAGDMINSLGAYGCEIIKCFLNAAEESERFEFRIK